MYPGSLDITRSFEPELACYRHLVDDSTDDVRTSRDLAAETTRMMIRGLAQGVQTHRPQPHHTHAARSPFVLRRAPKN